MMRSQHDEQSFVCKHIGIKQTLIFDFFWLFGIPSLRVETVRCMGATTVVISTDDGQSLAMARADDLHLR